MVPRKLTDDVELHEARERENGFDKGIVLSSSAATTAMHEDAHFQPFKQEVK